MFENCYSLTSINIPFMAGSSDWTYAEGMFKNCYGLTEFEIPLELYTSLETTKEMFSGCKNIKSINLQLTLTREIKDVSKMFYNCQNLNYVSIGNFQMMHVKYYEGFFEGVGKNITIVFNENYTPENITELIKNITSKVNI